MEGQSFEIPLQRVNDAITQQAGVNLYVLRTDLNHQHISGNKLYKLKYNVEEACRQQKKTLLTFGGAFSNHIAATAAAGKEQGFKTIGIIRGDETAMLNPTLAFASQQGMQLHFISREKYRQKDDTGFMDWLSAELYPSTKQQFSDCYIIPEGGSNALGIKGCMEITQSISIPFDYVCCPCGTGTTLAGIVLSLKEDQQALGFQVLKGENYIHSEVKKLLAERDVTLNNWQVNAEYHFGGYAKYNAELLAFIKQFEAMHHIPLDFVYTGKMVFGVYELMKKNFFERGKTIVIVHTGGLQGNAGLYGRGLNPEL